MPVGGQDSLYVKLSVPDTLHLLRDSLSFSWTSTDSSVVAVDAAGRVRANIPGEAIIRASAAGHDSIAPACTLVVFEQTLPLVYLTAWEEIPNEPKVSAWMKVIDEKGRQTFENFIGIEVRGSSSSGQPKKPYALETRTADDPNSNANIKLLSLPEENDWVFDAPYMDRTLVRPVLTFSLYRSMGWHASRYRFFELYLNGQYQGVYTLLEKIKQDRNRVDIIENTDAFTFDDMSFILKRDKFVGANNEFFNTRSGKIQYHYPEPTLITEPQRNFIIDYVTRAENALYGENFADPDEGYRKYYDVDSWVDFLLLQNICNELDAFWASNFFHRDKGGKIVHSPIWDYNLSWGNESVWGEGWQETVGFRREYWYGRMWQDTYFQEKTLERWRELREGLYSIEYMYGFIDSTLASIEDARIRNFRRWPIIGTIFSPITVARPSFEAEVDHLKDYIQKRVDKLDAFFDDLEETLSEDDNPPDEPDEPDEPAPTPKKYALYQNFPNPFNPSTTIRYYLEESGSVLLEVYTIRGVRVRTLVSEWQEKGEHSAVWNGTNNFGIPLPSGVYFYRLNTGRRYDDAKKMLLIR